jgi:hypothetical protein
VETWNLKSCLLSSSWAGEAFAAGVVPRKLDTLQELDIREGRLPRYSHQGQRHCLGACEHTGQNPEGNPFLSQLLSTILPAGKRKDI